ncbi:MAG: hypothetical protein JO072_09535 [Parafilimonas sp.]|nr:hypothetical protein [Parafilimonas sp.]
MKTIKRKLCAFIFVAGIFGCTKEGALNNSIPFANISDLQGSGGGTFNCDQFTYPDTIFYPKQSGSDYIVMPLHVLAGRYGSFPDVMKIDRNSGAINISKSETGLKYVVWFIPNGTKDTCKKFVTISGINYQDSIFSMNTSSSSVPIYNANTQQPITCNGTCQFGKNLISQGISINTSNGIIDLKQSILNGALGKNPKNGTFKDFLMQYKIGDQSNDALNKIQFRLFFYKTKAQIPDSIMNILNAKKSQVLLEDDTDPEDDDVTIPTVLVASATSKHGAGEVKCRPPYIIVTQK